MASLDEAPFAQAPGLFRAVSTPTPLRFLPDGSKFFEQDGAISGGMFVLGEIDPDGVFLIGEGYSTMATCHEATDLPAVVAFNSSNVPKVAKVLRAMYPRARRR